MATAAAAAVVEASEAIRGPGQPQSRDTLTGMERPTRIVETEGFERLFSHYTGLQGEELLEYLRNFQEKACEVYPYGCIRNGGFAALRERAHYEYPQVIEYAKKGGHTVVDLGCCMGTDVREFILDGGDGGGSNKVIAIDLQQDFIDLGQQLYKGPTPGIEFRVANLLDPNDTRVDDLKGKVTLLYTGAVFHLFEENDQHLFAEKINTLFAKTGEVVAFGTHRGHKIAGPLTGSSGSWMGLKAYAHDPESWRKMWTEVLGEDVKSWEIHAELKPHWTDAEYVDENRPVLQWSLWRKDS